MLFRTRVAPVILSVLAVALVALSGCREVKRVTAVWPEAESERTVAEPPASPRWPLTGLEAPSSAAISARPLSVKIENSKDARPQTGLNSADVVYESIAEGGITRFNCIFHSVMPADVGPVRSARLSDIWIVPQYDALFVFSGASHRVNRAVNSAGLPNLSQDVGVSKPYRRSRERKSPHNLYLSPSGAVEEAKRRGMRVTSAIRGLQFDKRSTGSTSTISTIEVPFSQANTSKWTWDAAGSRYLRFNNGVVHKDAETGAQVSADNIVVIWAKYDAAARDAVGSTTYDVTLGGKGRATVFRDGVRIECTWEASRDVPPTFRDQDGKAVKLKPGRTWFEVIPLDGTITIR